MNIYQSPELKPTFIEICNPKKTNVIISCIYKHRNKNVNELLDKLPKENETIFLPGDFNINLLNHDTHPPTHEFLDLLLSADFLAHIIQSTRVKSNSKKLIDNILSNMTVPNIISRNLTASILNYNFL